MPYFNNKIICDLVEEKHGGIISLLVKIWLIYGPTETQTRPQNQNKADLLSSHKGRGMFTSWRGLRSHLPGEDGGEDWWSPSFRHVSSLYLRDPAVRPTRHMSLNVKTVDVNNFLSPADIDLQTKKRGKHWKEDTSAFCTMLEKLHTV